MNEEIEAQLWSLLLHIEASLDIIQAETKARLEAMARSTGQRTRTDRL